MRLSHLGHATRIGVKTFFAVLMVQVAVWVFIAVLELAGLQQVQRQLLESITKFYEPSRYAFAMMVPAEWQFTGNVLLGFLAEGFGVVVYSLFIGLVTTLIARHQALRRAHRSPGGIG